jgi:hypothetical protein
MGKFHESPAILWLTAILLLVLSPSVSASFIESWGEYQNMPSSRGFTSAQQGNWDSLGTTSTITDGAAFQPLSADIDNDGNIEIVGSDGNNLKVWEWKNGILVLDD